MKRFVIAFFILTCFGTKAQQSEVFELQRKFFDAVRNDNWKEAEIHSEDLSSYPKDNLSNQLNTEPKKLAFWINTYNTYILYLLKREPELYKNRDDFFKKDRFSIAGESLSFDKVEHGIIRSSKNKYSLGYFGKFFVDDFEERFRLKTVDYRIHFALNCGAKSCPPVVFYDYKMIDIQLNQSSRKYLEATVELDRNKNDLFVPILAFWFKADFGGSDGIIRMLKKYGFAELLKSDPDIEFLDYNWELLLDNYSEP